MKMMQAFYIYTCTEIMWSNWAAGWQRANAKTRWPDYNKYPYIVKFAQLQSNEEYRTMYNAKWGRDSDIWNMETSETAAAHQQKHNTHS